jgi:hypothetical protein
VLEIVLQKPSPWKKAKSIRYVLLFLTQLVRNIILVTAAVNAKLLFPANLKTLEQRDNLF